MKRMNIGVIGTGKIAMQVTGSMKQVEGVKLYAVCSRKQETGQRFSRTSAAAAAEQAGEEYHGGDGHADPDHGPPAMGADDEPTQRGAEYHRGAGDQHIEGKSLRYGVLRKLRHDIRQYHRGDGRGPNAHDEAGGHHKDQRICEGGQMTALF